MNKKRVTGIAAAAGILIVAVIIAVVCVGKSKKHGTGGEFSVIGDGFATEDGVFYCYNDGHAKYFLKYIDYETGSDVFVCNKPDCSHSDDSCMAFYADLVKACDEGTGDAIMSVVFEVNDKLYVSTWGEGNIAGNSSSTMYRQDVDGNNREKLFSTDECIADFVCADDSFYFVTRQTDPELLEQYEGKTSSDLSESEEEQLWTSEYVNLYRYDTSSDELICVAEHIYEQGANYNTRIIPSDSETGFYIFTTWHEDGAEYHDLAFYDVAKETLTKNAVDFTEQGQYIYITPTCVRNNRFYYGVCQMDEDGWFVDDTTVFAYYDMESKETVPIADAGDGGYVMDDRLIINMGYGEDSSGEPEYTYRRYAYYDFDEDEFYVLDEGAAAPLYSSGDKGVVDRTDYYAMDCLGEGMESIDEYRYEITDMESYYKENWHKYSGDYNGFLTVY